MRKLKETESGIILYSKLDCRKESINGKEGMTSYSGDMYTLVNMVMCAMENDDVLEKVFVKAVLHYLEEKGSLDKQS